MKVSLSAKGFTPEQLEILKLWYSGEFMDTKITKKQTQTLLSVRDLLSKPVTKTLYRIVMREVNEAPTIARKGLKGTSYVATKMANRPISFTISVARAQTFFEENFNYDRTRDNHIALILSCTVPAKNQFIVVNDLLVALKADKQKEMYKYIYEYARQQETICMFTEPPTVTIEKVLIPIKTGK